MTKYAPLSQYLLARPRVDTELTFEEIEKILGFRLPASAHEHNAWWANEHSTHVQARAWMDAGWQVWRVRRSEKKVYFRPLARTAETLRVSESTQPFVGDAGVIAVDKSRLRGSALRLLEDYQEENGGSIADAIVGVLNGMAIERRRQLLERFPTAGTPSSVDSAELIRQARDAR